MGLSEYFKRCILKAKKEKYVVILSLIARYSDAKAAYDKLEKDWASLNDLTYDKVLMVFSLPRARHKASFFHTPGKPNYEGKICPFVELINGKRIEDNNGYIRYEDEGIDWKQRHSQTITEFVRDFNIPRDKIPCLFVYDLKTDKQTVIPINQNTDIYTTVKGVIEKIVEYGRRQCEIEDELEKYAHIEAYYNLYEELEKVSSEGSSKQDAAIRKVLYGEKTYKEVKEAIGDSKIRRDLKRLGQWKRQYVDLFESKTDRRLEYESLTQKRLETLEGYEKIWEEVKIIPIKEASGGEDDQQILCDLLNACICLQEDSKYFNELENPRNDNVRNLLKMAGHDVKDQTRRGLSATGMDAGEVDILIEEDGHTVTIIEALNLSYVDATKLDEHIDKIYGYDTVGNKFNVILVYVKTKNFADFCKRYYEHIKEHKYAYALISSESDIQIGKAAYSDLRIMKTIHDRNGYEVSLYHICVLFRERD